MLKYFIHKKQMDFYFSGMRILIFLAAILVGNIALAQKLYPFEKKDKWGYMNQEGTIVINPIYDYADDFNEGYAVVALGNLPCLIDANQKRYIDTGMYQYIGKYSEGLCSVMDYKFKRYYVNLKAEKVITLDKEIYDAGAFNSGLAKVSKKVDEVEKKFGVDITNMGFKFAYINNKGEYQCEFKYDDAEDLNEGTARVKVGKKFGLINAQCKEIVSPTYGSITEFNEDLAAIELDGKYGFINKQGEEAIKPQFEFAALFSEGLAGYSEKDKWGFIDKSGKVVIPALYDGVKPFGEGMAAIQQIGKWGFIDKTGKLMMNPFYENVGYYNDDVCPVQNKGKWGTINKEGRIVAPFDFEFIGNYEDGIAEVIFRDINLYLDLRGNLLPRLK